MDDVGRRSSTFFSAGVVILRILQRYSAEESWVENVLRRRGSSVEGFFVGGVFVGGVFDSSTQCGGMDLCERDGSEGRVR
ncbi:wall-associated receptor kinase 2-like [Cucumis melo var. makuwa]|uniref:Wall-associated receptor kinase 2-like n=1 Tax=Cucumis melo var. makuwa TaxID=1194695 RepID=A0A5A7TBT0_CUCMM|nr:wall-associated receptor kinase 2-like [Cucumis melo var. makuwa]